MDICEYRSSVGNKVRQERLRHGWTQEELAEKIDMCASFIGQIERGIKTVSFDTLIRLSLIFDVKAAEFLQERGSRKPRKTSHSIEGKVASLLKGYTLHEQKAIYRTLKYMLRQNRKLAR